MRPAKRIVIDERERFALAQSFKVKAMDALKVCECMVTVARKLQNSTQYCFMHLIQYNVLQLSGQKQQIKLTLKAPGSTTLPPSNKRQVTGLPELPELNLVRRGMYL